MPNQIPSAFLIRALARRPSEHCDRCGHRMFVKRASGLCPFCLADRPVRPIESLGTPVAASEPFAPRIGEPASWRQLPLGRRVRDFVTRSRRPAGDGPLATIP
jgi:hypothetical protein